MSSARIVPTAGQMSTEM